MDNANTHTRFLVVLHFLQNIIWTEKKRDREKKMDQAESIFVEYPEYK